MKSLMLAVTRARPAVVARARIWSSGSATRAGPATTACASWPLARSCWAMVSQNISSSSSGQLTRLPGEQVALAPPGIFGGVFGRPGGGDLGIDLAGIGRPVPDRDPQQAHGDAGVAGHQGEQVAFSEVGLGGPRGLDRADGFPDVRSAGQGRAPAGGACPERDAWVLAHPEGFIDEPVRGRGQGHAGVGGGEGCQPLGHGSVEPYRCR